ncbi:MAG TPA: diphthine--ammonia ligase [Elusimicrobiota bacterium]|nr:diphthine--ammonia ligase [Elusimicrobiota bacterium]
MNEEPVASSWSGGKDSCLACYKALRAGHPIGYLLNFISRESRRACFHGLEADLIKLQAERVGIPLVQKEVSPDMKKYEEEFKEAVSGLRARGVKKMVFGDIYLLEHQNWIERVCGELRVEAMEPLWNAPPEDVLNEFLDLGFKAVIVSCKADVLGKEFLGRVLDKPVIDEFKARGVCPCGENGEYHTLVVDGPMFKKGIRIMESETVLKDGFWKHWFWDIKKYQ